MAYNFPDAPTNGQIIQTAGQRFKWVAASTRWEYEGVAQFAGGTPVVPGTNTWTSVTGTTLTSTDCVQLSLDNATWSQSAAVAAGGTYYTRWDPGVTCAGAAHGTTITGTITDSADGATQSYSLTLDKIPDAFTFAPATNSVGPTTVTPVASFTLSGLNSPASLWGALTTTSGGTAPSTAEYSTDNVTFTAIPAAAGSATVENGQTIYVRFTTGDTTSTTDTLTLRVGESVANSVSGTYVVTVSKAAFSPTAPTTPTVADATTTSCITWDAGADTIYGTGCLEFNVNGGAFTQANTAVANGDTVCTRWKAGTGVGTTCSDAVHGTTITGTIESATRQLSASLLIDRQPDAFDFTDQTNIATSTQATSNTVTISGTNADSYLQWTPDATNPLTTVQASINGGAYVAVPAAGTYTLSVPPGATVTVQGTTGAGVSTGYTGTFTLGDSVANTTDTWTVTTSAAVPSITAPTVTAPTDASTGITTSPTVTTSTYTPLNGAGAHNCTDWEVYKWVGTPGSETAPTTDPPGASYSLVSSATCDTVNLTSYPLTGLDLNTTHYVRAQYNDDASTGSVVASGFGPWSSFTTEATPAIGAAYGGGYFAGQINDGGTIYNLIVAPVTSGALNGQLGGSSPTTIQYKTTAFADAPSATVQNETYGGTTTDLFKASAAHPVFSTFINGATGPNAGAFNLATGGAGGGTGIGGYNDWYIPAKNELEILYYNLKPDTTSNNTSLGINPNAVPPRASNYTAANPAQTTNTLFQTGGAEAFSTANFYWSSTEYSSLTGNAWRKDFATGLQGSDGKNISRYARAVRRIAA